jgi:hypothetical protein
MQQQHHHHHQQLPGVTHGGKKICCNYMCKMDTQKLVSHNNSFCAARREKSKKKKKKRRRRRRRTRTRTRTRTFFFEQEENVV